MRQEYLAAGVTLLLFSFLLTYSFSGSSTDSSIVSPSLNQSINQTAQYLMTVNESGYLIFQPNLTQAYGYYSKAVNLSAKDPAQAQQLLNQARASASAQELKLQQYKGTSFTVMAILTILSGILLFSFMRPREKR